MEIKTTKQLDQGDLSQKVIGTTIPMEFDDDVVGPTMIHSLKRSEVD